MSGKESSSASVVLNYGLISRKGQEIYLCLTCVETCAGAYPNCYSTGIASSFPKGKAAGT